MFRRGGENLGVELLLCSTLVPLTFFRKCTPAGASVRKVGLFLQAGALMACKHTACLLTRAESRRQIRWD